MTSPSPNQPDNSNRLTRLFREERVRNIFYQCLVTGGILLMGLYLVSNTLDNLERQGISTGYEFLNLEASFKIGESPIEYDASDSYGRALWVGVLNTIKVSVTGVILATIIGTLVGIARLSHNPLLKRIAGVYIETFRNVPVLLQLVLWYTLINNALPSPRQALEPVENVFLSNRGLFMPIPEYHVAYLWMAVALVLGLVLSVFVKRWAISRQAQTGQPFPYVWASIGLTLGLMLLAYLFGGAPTEISTPALKGFNFRGGWRMSPEFAALLIGLTIYTSTYIAEVVRSGIEAVPKGQLEAAQALGLKQSKIMTLVVLPQALRVIIPPLTNQYLNLTKNSSLAVAVGYPDLVSISNTTMNQTGQAIEAISIFMAIYLTLSLLISLFKNWYNKKMALVER
jgi:general L-amino acid transport system permease protein